MAKGQYVPSGVKYNSFEQSSSKGKFHPAEVNAGQSANKVISGSTPAHSMNSGTRSVVPDGVKENSGKEHYTSVKHKHTAATGPTKKSGADAHPAGVRKFKDSTV